MLGVPCGCFLLSLLGRMEVKIAPKKEGRKEGVKERSKK